MEHSRTTKFKIINEILHDSGNYETNTVHSFNVNTSLLNFLNSIALTIAYSNKLCILHQRHK